jgi:Predicted secreted protein containing a PDZ domain
MHVTLFAQDDAAEPERFSGVGPSLPSRRARVGWLFLAASFVLVFILILAPAPFVIEQPGPVFNTLGMDQPVWPAGSLGPSSKPQTLISVPGARTYPTAGSLDLLTVTSVGDPQQLPSWAEVISAWFTPSKAVIPVDVAYPQNQSTQQQDAENAQLMTDSQQDAIAAALVSLGYDFPQNVVVGQVIKGTPADGVLRVGDRIVEVDGHEVHAVQALRDEIKANGAKRPATLQLLRGGAEKTVQITPVVSSGSTILGIGASMEYRFPIDVKIKLDNVGGPSAGQMFALGIIDKLTPGQLNGGRRVAGTGTIDNEGEIGPIGGIRQKMYAASAAGANWFLAPASNCNEVAGHVPGGMHVFAVTTLKDSLAALKAVSTGASTAKLPTCSAG